MSDLKWVRVVFFAVVLLGHLPVRSAPVEGFLHRGIEMGEGWRWWRALGAMHAEHFPWVYHSQHGWLYLAPSDHAAVHAWSPDLGWLWLDLDTYPWLHSAERGWLYYSGDGVEGEARFYSRMLGKAIQRRGSWMLPAPEVRLRALPLSRFSHLPESLPDSLLNAPPEEADWLAAESLLPQLDGLDLAASRESMLAEIEEINIELEAVLALAPLLIDARYSWEYPRTEAGWRELLADLGAATDAGTLGLHGALIGLEAFDARWGPWIERVHTVADALDSLDQRLFRQRELLDANEIESLHELCMLVEDQIDNVLYGDADEVIVDFLPWRIDQAVHQAIARDGDQSARAARFLQENQMLMASFEQAFAIVAGSGDEAGVSLPYRNLRRKMEAATEVVNALSEMYWYVHARLEAGGPYRFPRVDGSGDSSDVTTVVVGGFPLGGPAYRERMRTIAAAYSDLDDLVSGFYQRPQPLLRLEHLSRLQADAALADAAVAQINAIHNLLSLPVPEDHSGSGWHVVGPEDE